MLFRFCLFVIAYVKHEWELDSVIWFNSMLHTSRVHKTLNIYNPTENSIKRSHQHFNTDTQARDRTGNFLLTRTCLNRSAIFMFGYTKTLANIQKKKWGRLPNGGNFNDFFKKYIFILIFIWHKLVIWCISYFYKTTGPCSKSNILEQNVPLIVFVLIEHNIPGEMFQPLLLSFIIFLNGINWIPKYKIPVLIHLLKISFMFYSPKLSL